MRLQRVATAMLAVLVVACGERYPAAEQPRSALRAPDGARADSAQLLRNVRRLQHLLREAGSSPHELGTESSLRIVGMDDGPVPAFELEASNGVRYSSRALVGQRAFVVGFFATWCDFCKVELQAMQRAFEQTGALPVIPVSVDGPETWGQVPGYLASFGIHAPAVRANDFPRFAAAYDPFDTVPLLVIVGRNGGLVDCLVGYDPAHGERLLSSLRLAQTIGPLAKPQLDAENEGARSFF
jgi:cytochrome c biogenesis protein CcmG, thiol:disulfide interchange protein DsbE